MQRKLTKSQMARVEAVIARRELAAANDPVQIYKPGPACSRCLQSKKYNRLLNGPNQSGKTNHAIYETAAMARGIHPTKPWYGPVTLLVLVPSRQQAVAVWGKRLLERCEMPGPVEGMPFIPPHEIDKIYWNYSASGKAPGRILLKNKSEIYFAWSGDESMWERIQGMAVDYVIRDEAVGSHKLGPEIVMRLVKVRSNTTWGGGVLWAGTPTLDNPEYEEFQRNCREGKPDFEEFFIQPQENPAVKMSVREAARDAMSEEDAAVRIDGGVSQVDRLRIYRRHWDDAKHLAPVDYEPQETDNLWIAFDPGIGHEAGILCCAINRDAPLTLNVVRFYCHKNMPLTYHVGCMAEWLEGRKLEGLVVDPKAFTRESSGKSIVTQIEEMIATKQSPLSIHRGIMRGRNGHWEGINQVWEYLSAGKVICNQLAPGMGLFRYQLINYKGREESRFTGPGGVVKKKDEAPDCLRYLITKEPQWEDRGKNPKRGMGGPVTPEAFAERLSEMTEDERRHHEQIQQSIKRLEAMLREDGIEDAFGSGRQIATGNLAW